MHIYRTLLERSGLEPEVSHRGTLAEAHTVAQGYTTMYWPDVRVELIDVPTDKDGILALMQGCIRVDDHDPVRTWKLGPRGGLVNIANGE